jgi:hypothetical protein
MDDGRSEKLTWAFSSGELNIKTISSSTASIALRHVHIPCSEQVLRTRH